MGILRVVNSGSYGNSYILECKGEYLLIELGVSYKKIMKMINYNLKDIVGVIVSHSHC